MNYREFRANRQDKLNKFISDNMFYAFSEEQFLEGMKKLNTSKVISIGAGGYLKQDKSEDFNALMKELETELSEYISDYTNLLEGLVYEMHNMEFSLNEDSTELLKMFGLSTETLTKNQIKVFHEAKKQYYNEIS